MRNLPALCIFHNILQSAAFSFLKNNEINQSSPTFGIAAIDSGHAGEGVLTLERYIISFPDNVNARLELARGYFVLGEDAHACEEYRGSAGLPPADRSPNPPGLALFSGGQVDGKFNNTINPFAQYAQLRYAGNNVPRDADFYVIRLGYRSTFIGDWQPLFTVSINGGQEHDIRGRPDLGRDIYGGRIALSVTPLPKWAVSAGGTYQKSRCQGRDTLPLTTRRDNYYALDAVASYAYTRNLSVRAELLLSKNDPNVARHEYRRDTIALKPRYDFK